MTATALHIVIGVISIMVIVPVIGCTSVGRGKRQNECRIIITYIPLKCMLFSETKE